MKNQKICVLGLGYIGLPTASIIATHGFPVLGVDINNAIVKSVNHGKTHFLEPNLEVAIKSAINSGNLVAATKPQKADVFIIAVPTPFKETNNNKIPNIDYVLDATRSIIKYLKPGDLLIIESTVPVGTSEIIAELLAQQRPDLITAKIKPKFTISHSSIYIAHCPERVIPGNTIRELIENDRIIGGINAESAAVAKNFYQTFIKGDITVTDSKTAELCKLVENSYRDVNIAFANELALHCDQLGLNVWEVINLANKHPRVKILQPGPGVGGHCIAVDPWFLIHSSKKHTTIIKAARKVNDSMPFFVVKKIKAAALKFKSPIIGCLGLAYKNDIDDLRESPAVKVVAMLRKAKIGKVLVCEPNLPTSKEYKLATISEIVQLSDIIVILTKHREFLQIHKNQLKNKIIIDTRGLWNQLS